MAFLKDALTKLGLKKPCCTSRGLMHVPSHTNIILLMGGDGHEGGDENSLQVQVINAFLYFFVSYVDAILMCSDEPFFDGRCTQAPRRHLLFQLLCAWRYRNAAVPGDQYWFTRLCSPRHRPAAPRSCG